MEKTFILALIVALSSGVTIGTQSALTNHSGRLVGPIRTGLLMNFFGGLWAGLVLLGLVVGGGTSQWRVSRAVILILVVAGALGILIISGIAYALPRVGIAAGLASIILGQMAVAVIIDTFGWGGADPLPLDIRRVVGLLVMGIAVVLLLPRNP